MKEYIVILKDSCNSNDIWNAVKLIKPKTSKMEIMAITTPIFSILIKSEDLQYIKNLPYVQNVKLNDTNRTYNRNSMITEFNDIIKRLKDNS